jgi:hypothetical protein
LALLLYVFTITSGPVAGQMSLTTSSTPRTPGIVARTLKISQDVASSLLGTWEEQMGGDKQIFYGFLPNGIARQYYGADPASSTVSQFMRYKVTQQGTSTVLQMSWYPDKNITYPDEEYVINSLTDSSLDVTDNSFGENSMRHFVRVGSEIDESNRDFSRSNAQTKALCDDIVQGNVTSNVFLPISCDIDIGHNTIMTFNFQEDGSLQVLHGSRLVLSLKSPDYDFRDQFFDPILGTRGLSLQDVTYDGYLDLEWIEGMGAYQGTYGFIAYHPNTDLYDSAPFLELTNPEVGTSSRTITEYARGRAVGDEYTINTYHFQDGGYVLIKQESQNLVSDSYIDTSTSTEYVHTISELQNGKMVVTKQEYLTSDQEN